MAESTAFDSALGLFQGRVQPRYASAADTSAINDLVATGSTSTVINVQVGGYQSNSLQGRLLRIGNAERTIASNTASSITVTSAFDLLPTVNQGVIIKGGSFVWALGFDFQDRKEHFMFGDGVQVENHLPLTGISLLTARVWIKQPKTMLDKRDLSSSATIISNSSSVVTAIDPGLPEIDDFVASGSTTTVIQLTVGGLTVGAYTGRTLQIYGEERTISTNGATSITVTSAFPSVPAVGTSLRIVEQGPLITTATAHFVAVGDSIAVSNVVWTGAPAVANRAYPVRRIISSTVFELAAPAGGSGTYAGGGNIGLRERFDFPGGVTENDVGRVVTISGSSNTTNNGTFRIVGIRYQPSKSVATQVWFERVGDTLNVQGIVGAGSTTTVVQVTSPTLVSNSHIGQKLLTRTATGTAQESTITSNTTSSITVSPAFGAAPATSSNFLAKTDVVFEAVGVGVTITGKGARWKVMLLVKDGSGTWVPCSRVVQQATQTGFFRADLRAYVKGITADRMFAIRLELIEHNPTNIYPM